MDEITCKAYLALVGKIPVGTRVRLVNAGIACDHGDTYLPALNEQYRGLYLSEGTVIESYYSKSRARASMAIVRFDKIGRTVSCYATRLKIIDSNGQTED